MGLTPEQAAALGATVDQPALKGEALRFMHAVGKRRREALGMAEPAPSPSMVTPRGIAPGVSEDDEHRALARVLDAVGLLWMHVPNGMKASSRTTAARMVGLGLKSGAPDVWVLTPAPHNDRPTVIEMKAPRLRLKRAPEPSPRWRRSCFTADQQAWLDALAGIGWNTLVAYSAAEAVEQLMGLGYGT